MTIQLSYTAASDTGIRGADTLIIRKAGRNTGSRNLPGISCVTLK